MCVHCGDVNKVEIKSWDQDQDQTKAKAKITRPRSRPNRSGVEPLPSECTLYKTMWQTKASSSIKLCESDKHVSLSQHVRTSVQLCSTAVNVSSYSCKKIEFKKMLSARSFHSDQTKASTTSPRPRTKPARPRPRPKPYSASLRPVLYCNKINVSNHISGSWCCIVQVQCIAHGGLDSPWIVI